MRNIGLAAILFASAQSAQAAWGLRFEVCLNDGDAWRSDVFDVDAGQVVKFRFGAYFDQNSPPFIASADGSGTARALTRFTGSNQATGFRPGDKFQNVVRTISSGNADLVQTNGSTIGTSTVTSFGSQLFLTDVPLETYKEIYRGEVQLGLANGGIITLKNKTFGSGDTPGLTFYNSASPINKQSGAPQAGGPGRVDENAIIVLRVPTPASLALIALGGLVAARRRRF